MTETAPTEAGTRRLFFALWPDATTRDALNRTGLWLHRHWGGRRMRADTLHLTLSFLGDVPAAQLDVLLRDIQPIAIERFELSLDRPGYWPHNHIGWLGLSLPSAPLEALVQALRDQLGERAIAFDNRPHTPHVTLLRKSQGGEALTCLPVKWSVDEFVLVASDPQADDAHYAVLKRWPLAG
ncbi:MAG: 2'-5' RNA ligase [Hydrogenophilales bacterium 16-62-9]|nr:MAG: 2'-5' RNA ligase [Hydrogenophilales bacterium 16-62-9]